MKVKNTVTTGSVSSPAAKVLTQYLKRQRQEQGLTMREIGERMNGPHSFVGKIENNERRIDIVEYAKYCQLLGIDAMVGFQLVMEQVKAELAQRS
jgi:transcriptional regulator with XRE-family HTH domain